MAAVPPRIALRLLGGFSLPLNVLRTVNRDVVLDDPHVAVVVALAAQAQLVRTGNEFQNL